MGPMATSFSNFVASEGSLADPRLAVWPVPNSYAASFGNRAS